MTIGLLLLTPNCFATTQVVQYFTHTPVSVCQPSDTNSNCGGAGGYTTVPALASSSCSAGQYSADSSYYYICESSNTWLRTSIATWGSGNNVTYLGVPVTYLGQTVTYLGQ